jgi:hypothetical protein
MKKKYILLIAFFVVLALSLWGLSLIPLAEGHFILDPMNKHTRPFTNFRFYYPTEIHVKEQYQKLHIKEMSYELKGKAGISLKDKSWDNLYTDNEKRTYNFYDSLTGEYRFILFGIDQHIRKNVKLNKLFKGKKHGDIFKYTVKIVYSLDDEPESTQIIEHNVKVIMPVASLLEAIYGILSLFTRAV